MAKFPWGDEPMSMGIMFGLTLFFSLVIGLILALGDPGIAVAGGYPTPAELNGVALVTCVFMLMWYVFLGNQVGIKFSGLTGEVADQAKMVADRVVINTQEQAMPFLVLMWLEAVLVNPVIATRLGWVYVISRYLYPVTYAIYGQFTVLVEIAQQPGYIIIFYYLLTVFFKCLNGTDIFARWSGVSPFLMILFALVCGLCSFIAYLLLAAPTTMLIIKGVKSDKGVDDEEYEYEDEEVGLNGSE